MLWTTRMYHHEKEDLDTIELLACCAYLKDF